MYIYIYMYMYIIHIYIYICVYKYCMLYIRSCHSHRSICSTRSCNSNCGEDAALRARRSALLACSSDEDSAQVRRHCAFQGSVLESVSDDFPEGVSENVPEGVSS